MKSDADIRRAPDLRKPIKVFDFFCGCGGTSSGLQAAGLEIVLGLDNDHDAANSFRSNFPEASVVEEDILTLPIQAFDGFVESVGYNPLLFAVCAPCQPYSQLSRGTASRDDERFGLLGEVLKFIARFLPEFLFVENVPGVRHGVDDAISFDKFVTSLRSFGYLTHHEVIRCQDYGVPQRRARLVLLASRIGPIAHPPPTHGRRRPIPEYSTVAEWIKDMPEISAGETHPQFANHRSAKLSDCNLRRIRAMPEGGDLRDLPDGLIPSCHRSGFRGFTDVYGRLKWDAPAPAMTTRCISYSNGRFGHPEQDRAISVREAACLQTLPLDFAIEGNLNSQARQVGNAVPRLLAQLFGEYIRGMASEVWRKKASAIRSQGL